MSFQIDPHEVLSAILKQTSTLTTILHYFYEDHQTINE